MKKNRQYFGAVSIALFGAMFSLQACGRGDLSRVTPMRGLDGGAAPTSLPPGKSVGAVNSWLIGKFAYQRSGCRLPDNSYIGLLQEATVPFGVLQITDNQVVSDVTNPNGCRVVSTYAIIGVDANTLVVGNRQLSVSIDGFADTGNACGSLIPTMPAGGMASYSYEYRNGDLSIFSPPREPCEATDRNEDVYARY